MYCMYMQYARVEHLWTISRRVQAEAELRTQRSTAIGFRAPHAMQSPQYFSIQSINTYEFLLK